MNQKAFTISTIMLPASIEIESRLTSRNADPSIDWTLCGGPLDCGDDGNVCNSVRVDLELGPNLIDQSDCPRENMMNKDIDAFFNHI
jgi:hypothetical protein